VVAFALAQHRQTAPDGYVWGGEKPTDPRRDWGVWKGLLWSAGCADHPLHAARATTASILGEANVPLKTIAEILGHSQITTAWAFYVKSDDRQKREGLNAGWEKMIEGR
jgi:integrase